MRNVELEDFTMSKHTPETLAAICDRLVVHPYLKPAARSVGIDPSTLFAWLEKSRADPSSLSFVWSEVQAPFHQHVAAAMRMSVLLIESNARELALNGFDEVVTFQGRVQYEFDPRYIGVDDDTMVTLGLDKPSVEYHRYKRDMDGNAVPLKVKRKPSDALVTTVLRAHFRKLYGEHKSVSIGGGVLVIGARHVPTAPKTIENKAPEYVEMTPIEASDEEDVKRGGYLAVGPKLGPEELEELARQSAFDPREIEFVDEEDDGVSDAGASEDDAPIKEKVGDVEPNLTSNTAATGSAPSAAQPSSAQMRKPSLGASPAREDKPNGTRSAASGADRIGYGRPAPGGFKVC